VNAAAEEVLELAFAKESIVHLKPELTHLIQRHYEEIAWKRDKIPLDVDWERYGELERAGVVHFYTARMDGILIGYSCYIVNRHLHYKTTLFAQNDVLYIDKPYRGRKGAGFIRWCEEQLKALGVQVHGLHIKKWFDWSPLALRMGFEHMDGIYMKWIGN
jgi:hypothetical protein